MTNVSGGRMTCPLFWLVRNSVFTKFFFNVYEKNVLEAVAVSAK